MSFSTLLAFSSALAAGILALIASVRAGRSIALWAFAAGMLTLMVERACTGVALRQIQPEAVNTWLQYRSGAASLIPGFWLLFGLTYARQNADEFLRRWRWTLVFAFVVPVGLAVLLPRSLPVLELTHHTPAAVHFRLGPVGLLRYLLLLIASVLVLMHLERTLRASTGMIRWRIKFMLMGVIVLLTIQVFTASQVLLYRHIDLSIDGLNSGALLVAALLILRSLFRIEAAGMNVHPSHAVIQGSVTVVLAGVYLVLVGAMASLVSYFGGDDSFALKAFLVLLGLVGLAVLLQSDRVNLHLRHFVSRHFERPLHDYQMVWSRFTEATASRVEPAGYSEAVVKLLAETFNSLSVSLWQVDEQGSALALAASTAISPDRARELRPDAAGTATVLAHLREHAEPVEIESGEALWAAILRRCHPEVFSKGGNRVCVPILAGGEILALVLLGDRVGNATFTLQDIDLLKSIGKHVSSGLLNARLSQRLLQAREHEAFQTMAAFFVHDLKNAASSLSLMLQNLPTHFDDPEFREDALRGVGKSVAHINHLISRLSELRQELKIDPRESDLNEIVSSIAKGFEDAPALVIETEFAALPTTLVDREQFSKVVTNLILNAREAGNGRAHLRLSTSRVGAWAMIAAKDNGCGMSEEFLAKSLFRPFQTTKKNGLGIGMFQSKMIVEAHGGRIAVESTRGEGTTFRVFLPLSPATP